MYLYIYYFLILRTRGRDKLPSKFQFPLRAYYSSHSISECANGVNQQLITRVVVFPRLTAEPPRFMTLSNPSCHGISVRTNRRHSHCRRRRRRRFRHHPSPPIIITNEIVRSS